MFCYTQRGNSVIKILNSNRKYTGNSEHSSTETNILKFRREYKEIITIGGNFDAKKKQNTRAFEVGSRFININHRPTAMVNESREKGGFSPSATIICSQQSY